MDFLLLLYQQQQQRGETLTKEQLNYLEKRTMPRNNRNDKANSNQYDDKGKLAVWMSDSDNERAPLLTGKGKDVTGVDSKVSLWPNNGLEDAEFTDGNVEDIEQCNTLAELLDVVLGLCTDHLGNQPVFRGTLQFKEDAPSAKSSGSSTRRQRNNKQEDVTDEYETE